MPGLDLLGLLLLLLLLLSCVPLRALASRVELTRERGGGLPSDQSSLCRAVLFCFATALREVNWGCGGMIQLSAMHLIPWQGSPAEGCTRPACTLCTHRVAIVKSAVI